MAATPAIPEEARRLIDVVGAACSAVMLEQLTQAKDMLQLAARGHQPMTDGEREVLFDSVLSAILTRQPINTFGLRKTIVVNIAQFVKPGSKDATSMFVANNTTLVPSNLIQRPDAVITREASKDFVQAMSSTVLAIVNREIKRGGEELVNTFTREQQLYKKRHNMESSATCCIFRLMEEDYESPDHKVRCEIVRFGFKCNACGDRHELKVIR